MDSQKEGLSHNPGECASLEEIMVGADLLTEALRRLAAGN